jgi:hypothetical protein
MSPRKLAFFLSCAGSLVVSALAGPALADVIPGPRPNPIAPMPPQSAGNRDAVALARRDPEISKQIVAARGGSSDQTGPAAPTETAVQVTLGGQCGFAGCSAQTLVAFQFRSAGANTTSRSVLALVTCPPVPSRPCNVAPAEIHAAGNGLPQK